jgi:hypothetical protein
MKADPDRMARIADPLPTKSAKIRALARAGFERADIARFLGIRYQHVRNVLMQPPPASERDELPPQAAVSPPGFAEGTAEWPGELARDHLKVSADGTVRLSKDLLGLAEIRPGETIRARVVDGEVRLSSYSASIRRAQRLFRKYVPAGTKVVDAFLAERQRMWGEGD